MHWDVSKHAPLFCFIGPKNCWFCMVSNHHTCTYFFWPKPYIPSTCLQLGVTNIDAPASSSSRPNVFVGVLVSGLLAALGIIVGYLKCQRRSDVKEVKLVSTFYGSVCYHCAISRHCNFWPYIMTCRSTVILSPRACCNHVIDSLPACTDFLRQDSCFPTSEIMFKIIIFFFSCQRFNWEMLLASYHREYRDPHPALCCHIHLQKSLFHLLARRRCDHIRGCVCVFISNSWSGWGTWWMHLCTYVSFFVHDRTSNHQNKCFSLSLEV